METSLDDILAMRPPWEDEPEEQLYGGSSVKKSPVPSYLLPKMSTNPPPPESVDTTAASAAAAAAAPPVSNYTPPASGQLTNKRVHHSSSFDWKSAPSFGIKNDPGRVIEETDTVVFKVPEGSSRKKAIQKRQTRFGEEVGPSFAMNAFMPMNEVTQQTVNRRMRILMNKIITFEDNLNFINTTTNDEHQHPPQKKHALLSDFVVKLYLEKKLRSEKLALKVLEEGTRCEAIPNLPPFQAFDNFANIRDSLYRSPSTLVQRVTETQVFSILEGDGVSCLTEIPPPPPSITKLFPLKLFLRYDEYDDISSKKQVLKSDLPVLDGVEAISESTRTGLFRVKSFYTHPNQTLLIKISAMDVHIFNTNPKEFISISGILRPSMHLPALDKLYTVSSFCPKGGTVPFRRIAGGPALFPLKEASDKDYDRKILCIERFTRAMLSIELPPRTTLLDGEEKPRFYEKACNILEEKVLDLNPSLKAMLYACTGGSLDQVYGSVRAKLYNLFAGYIEWRYFLLPDFIIACLCVDYIILNPGMNRNIYLRCPNQTKGEDYHFIKHISNLRSIADPAQVMIFDNYSTDFDHYGSAMILYKFVCETKAHLLAVYEKESNERQREKEEAINIQASPQPFYSPSTHQQSPAPQKRRSPFIAPKQLARFIDMDEIMAYHLTEVMSDRIDSIDQLPQLAILDDVYATVLANMQPIYEFKRYPSLCKYPRKKDRSFTLTDDIGHSSSRQRKRKSIEKEESSDDDDEAENDKSKDESSSKQESASSSSTSTVQPEKITPTHPQYAKALYKSLLLGSLSVVMPKEKAPKSKVNDLDQALEIYEANVTMIKEKEARNFGRNAYQQYPRLTTVASNILFFMRDKKLLQNPDLEEKEIMAFILGNRRELKELNKYPHLNKRILYRLNPNSDLDKWYREVEKLEKERISKRKKKPKRTMLTPNMFRCTPTEVIPITAETSVSESESSTDG